MNGEAKVVAPDNSDSDDDNAWLRELISAKGDPPVSTVAAAWNGDSEITEWFAELCSATGSSSTPSLAAPVPQPEVKAVVIQAAAPASAREKPARPRRGRGGGAPTGPTWNPYGYPVGSEITHPGMPTPCFSKEPGAGTCPYNPNALNPDPRDWWGPAIGMRPLGHIRHDPPAAQPAAAQSAPALPAPAQLAPAAPRPQKRKLELACLPEAVLRLPATLELVEQIAEDPAMEWQLPPPRALAGAVLEHAAAVVRRRVRSKVLFKIGLTTNPIHRWHNPRYGYRLSHDNFDRMVILFATDRGEAAAFLEAALIGMFKQNEGCRNIASGGESVRPTYGPFFTYMVIQKPRA